MGTRRKGRAGWLAAISTAGLLLAGAMSAQAALIPVPESDWVDFRSTDDNRDGLTSTLVATDGWSGEGNDGFKISWNIFFDDNEELYTYSYTFSAADDGALGKGLSHWIFGVSPEFVVNEQTLQEFLYEDDSGSTAEVDSNVPKMYEGTNDSGSNPYLGSEGDGELFGIKWNTDGDDATGPITVSWESTILPIWGSFYAKDGKEGQGPNGIWATAENIGLDNGFQYPADEPFNKFHFIPIMDTNDDPPPPPAQVPVPAPLALIGLGLLAMGTFGRRRPADVAAR